MCGPEFASEVAAVGDGLDVVGGEAHGMFPGEGVVYGVPAEPAWEVVPAGFSLEGFAEVSVCPVVSHAGTGLLCHVVGRCFCRVEGCLLGGRVAVWCPHVGGVRACGGVRFLWGRAHFFYGSLLFS